MKSSLPAIVVVVFLLPSFETCAESKGQANPQAPVIRKHSGKIMASFPDVCKTPDPGKPIPSPDPNIAHSSDIVNASKQTKTGGKITVTPKVFNTKQGRLIGYRVTVQNKKGRTINLKKSVLLELADGTYCAVCVADGRVTRVITILPR